MRLSSCFQGLVVFVNWSMSSTLRGGHCHLYKRLWGSATGRMAHSPDGGGTCWLHCDRLRHPLAVVRLGLCRSVGFYTVPDIIQTSEQIRSD